MAEIDVSVPTEGESSRRIVGFDVARALALLGMIVVHFAQTMAVDLERPQWLATIIAFLDGRAAATFVVLAGIGLPLMARRAVSGTDVGKLARLRRTVLRRGLFLLVIGFVNLTFFEGDILRVYGVSLMMAAVLIDASGRRLLAAAGAFVAGFLLLLAVFDYEAHWDWDTMYYDGQWTPAGIVRHLFYDGFRSVFPWTGLLIFGIWLGRRDWRDRRTNTRILGASALVMLATEVGSWLAVRAALKRWPQADPETVTALVGTESMPPLPLFLLAAGGTAVLVIALCVRVSLWRGMPALLSPLVATGQLALTWYFAHIVIGLGTVKTLGWEASFPLTTSVATGLLFFAVAVVLSWVWKRRFRLGPLEATMRWMTG